MRILRRYLFRTIVTTSVLVLAVLLSLGAFIEFVGQLDDLGVGDYQLPQVIVWVLLQLPTILVQMLPIAVLLGALLGLGTLAAKSELIVLRAAGVSPRGIARAVLATGAILALLGALLGEYVAPPLERYARQYRALAKFGQEGLSAGESAWIRDGNIILNVSPPSEEQPEGAVFLFRLGEDNSLAAVGSADSVTVEDGGRWMLNHYAESAFRPDAVETTHARSSLAIAGVDADLLGLTVVREETLSGVALWRYVRYLKRNGLDAREYEIAFWSRIATAVAVAIMCMLAVPFVLGSQRGSGSGGRLLAGLGIGLTWFLVNRTLVDGGEVWGLDPMLVAWLPTLLLAVATIWVVARAR